jgi:hypothetical protein
MPPSQPLTQQSPATLLETDEDVRNALSSSQVSKADVTVGPQPVPPSPAQPYRPTKRPPIALLTVLDDGESTGQVIRLRDDRFVVGRTEGDLRIPHDAQIAARHLEIVRHQVGATWRWQLMDLPGTTGLFLRVSRTLLADGAEILIGRSRYRFVSAASSGSNFAHLIEMMPSRENARLPLTQAELWIGSDLACTIRCAEDPFVEPRHARIYLDLDGGWHAQNNKTANGLWLRVSQIAVDEACLFQIGEQRSRLKVGG